MYHYEIADNCPSTKREEPKRAPHYVPLRNRRTEKEPVYLTLRLASYYYKFTDNCAEERSRIGLRSSRLDLASQAQKRSKQRSLVIGSTGRMDVQEGSGITQE